MHLLLNVEGKIHLKSTCKERWQDKLLIKPLSCWKLGGIVICFMLKIRFSVCCGIFSLQEKRMSKATEVMMQYVENLKRTYEKDHAELMEFKKLANQNSSRSYGSPGKSNHL